VSFLLGIRFAEVNETLGATYESFL
jgi:hypothetical protein